MNSEQASALIIASFPIFIGCYFLMLGQRKIGKKPGQDKAFDERMEKFGGTFKMIGPLLILFGLLFVGRAFFDL